MIRIVLDTSVLIRYLIRPSLALRRLIEEIWLDDEATVVSSPELMAELRDVLARDSMRRFIAPDEGQTLLDALREKAEMLPSLGVIPAYTRDAKDDKFIACALAGQAEYLVSVDEDILALGALAGVRIVTPQELVNQLEETR